MAGFLRALWDAARGPAEPAGIPLDAATAPRLVALVDEVRRALGAPSLHRILLTPEVNAALIELPSAVRLRSRAVLLLGLPLMHAMSAEELRAVIAHEIGHLARRHGRLRTALWRARPAVESGLLDSGFVTRLAAWSFARWREHEGEADAHAAQLVGSRLVADAITRVPLVSIRVEQAFWPEMRRRARAGELLAPHEELAAFVRRPFDGSDRARLDDLLARPARSGDSHPRLADRLVALGQDARLPPAIDRSAADDLLSEVAAPASRMLDEAWREAFELAAKDEPDADSRALRDERRSRAATRRTELRALAQRRTLEASEAWELAMVVGELEGRAAERELLEKLNAAEPDHAPTCFELGRLRLLDGDASGGDLLERASVLDPALARRSAELLLVRARSDGDAARAAELSGRLAEADVVEAAARRERAALPWSLRAYKQASLPHDVVDALRALLPAVPGARRALLLERVVEILPERRAWLLGVERDPSLDGEAADRARDREIAERLLDAVDTGGHLTCLVASAAGRVLLSRLAEIPGAVIWRRS